MQVAMRCTNVQAASKAGIAADKLAPAKNVLSAFNQWRQNLSAAYPTEFTKANHNIGSINSQKRLGRPHGIHAAHIDAYERLVRPLLQCATGFALRAA